MDEKSDLKDSLAQLGTKVGYDFSYDIQRLEEDIAESKEEPESLNEELALAFRVKRLR